MLALSGPELNIATSFKPNGYEVILGSRWDGCKRHPPFVALCPRLKNVIRITDGVTGVKSWSSTLIFHFLCPWKQGIWCTIRDRTSSVSVIQNHTQEKERKIQVKHKACRQIIEIRIENCVGSSWCSTSNIWRVMQGDERECNLGKSRTGHVIVFTYSYWLERGWLHVRDENMRLPVQVNRYKRSALEFCC